ncbi:MAG: HEAT repeat domain-containing protein [Planctomycetota bacterium]|nr:MAG: HEAT repeat domain-containing protein [Planctomycetota bacterium]
MIFLFNWSEGTDIASSKKLRKLEKDLEKPEVAILAATKLLELEGNRGFLIIQKIFKKLPTPSQVQVIKAFCYKKDTRGIQIFLEYFPKTKLPKELRRELNLALVRFSYRKEIPAFLKNIAVDKRRPLFLRELALDTLYRMDPFVSIGSYVEILDKLPPSLFRRASSYLSDISGHSFTTPQEWRKWWAKNKKRSQLDWLRDVNAKLREKIQKQDQQIYYWWRRYLQSIQVNNTSQYVQELIYAIEHSSNSAIVNHALIKISNLVEIPAEKEKALLRALVQFLYRPALDSEVQLSAVVAISTVALNSTSDSKAEVISLLLSLFKSHKNIKVRILACQTLAKLKSPRALPSFLAVLSDPKAHPDLVKEVIRNLSYFQEKKDNTILRVLLKRIESLISQNSPPPNSELISLAVEKLSELPYHNPAVLEKSRKILHLLLSQKNMKIRYFVANSLEKIGDISSLSPLLKSIDGSDNGARRMAITAITSIVERKQRQIPPALRKRILLHLLEKFQQTRFHSTLKPAIHALVYKEVSLLRLVVQAFWPYLLSNSSAAASAQYARWLQQLILQVLQKKSPPPPPSDDEQKCLHALVHCYLILGQISEAKKVLRSMASSGSLSKNVLHQFDLALCLLSKGEIQEAQKIVRKLSIRSAVEYKHFCLYLKLLQNRSSKEAKELFYFFLKTLPSPWREKLKKDFAYP